MMSGIFERMGMFMFGVTVMLSLCACNGIFENIYDEPSQEEKTSLGSLLSMMLHAPVQFI